MQVHNIPKEHIAMVAVKNKGNALDHPSAQLAAKITVEDVMNSETMVWPVQRLDISPPSDGAAAFILASEEVARKYTDAPVWIEGVGWNVDSSYWTNRDLYFPQYVAEAAKMAYKMAKIDNPPKQIDLAEPYDPFTYKELHHMEGLLLAKKGEAPIAAAGMMKCCECFWQLRNEAGKRQVDGAETAVAQAWGDLMQVGTVTVYRR
jgi:acetyl-CoA C-acetyltransferase